MDVDATSPDDDPIVSSYNVFIKPALPAHKRLLVLQHPNRVDGKKPWRPPTEVRVKPGSGMIEVDYPMDHSQGYDKNKGVTWGSALQKSTAQKSGGSHGLAGGFGVGAPVRTRGRGAAGDDDNVDWAEALRQDRVLRTQTLGGQCPETKDCRYMVGIFQGDNIHLTPVTSLVHLRPQLHHIDAASELEKLSRPREGPGAGPGAAGGGKEGTARAIHMTIKSAGTEGEQVVTETMADRLRLVQSENWQRMVYVDDQDQSAWDTYYGTLVVRPEGQEVVEGDGANADLEEHVPQLGTQWVEDDLLRAVSGIEKVEIKEEAEEPAKVVEKKKPGRPKGSTTAASKRGAAKGKAAAT